MDGLVCIAESFAVPRAAQPTIILKHYSIPSVNWSVHILEMVLWLWDTWDARERVMPPVVVTQRVYLSFVRFMSQYSVPETSGF